MTEKVPAPLVVPSIRAHMGTWVYYICSLKMRDIATRISMAAEVHESKSLDELLQRALTDRSSEIKNYLLSQKQRFFNALVVGTYGGNPQWYELDIMEPMSNQAVALDLGPLPEYIDGALGILKLGESGTLFAIDGQHRVAGIRAAVQENAELGDEEVCVIFVRAVTKTHRAEDAEGFERTRRLFTTLNRYARPVSKRDIIALDEDDVIAITTRYLVENYDLFRDKVSSSQPRSLHPDDQQSFTTIITLYDAINAYLRDRVRGWEEFKRVRPPDTVIAESQRRALDFWENFIIYFPPLQEVKDSLPEAEVAGRYRSRLRGGHLLFRPVGLLLVVRVVKRLVNEEFSLQEALERIAKSPMQLDEAPWVGLLWDATNKLMQTAPERQRVAERLLLYSIGDDRLRLRVRPKDLRRQLSGLLNKEESEVTLPTYV